MSARTLPKEWESLPLWVKHELLLSSEHLHIYNWHIQQLVNHGENMKAVWQLFESNREVFEHTGPVSSLLCLLNGAKHGTDPGYLRTDDDRRSIAEDVRKHANALLKLIHRLGTGGTFGMYPLGVANTIDLVAYEVASERGGSLFKGAIEAISSHLDEADIAIDAKRSIAQQLDDLRGEVAFEMMNLVSDPRVSLSALIDATDQWAKECGWGRSEAVWHVAATLKDWFGGNQLSATATLATAIFDEEISVKSVDGILTRIAGASSGKSQPRKKRKF